MDYNNGNGKEHPVTIYKSVISDDEDDAPPPKQSNIIFWYNLNGLPIGRQQAEEEAKQDIHHTTTTDFNWNRTANSPKLVVIEEDKVNQPTTSASELIRYHHRFGHIYFSKLKIWKNKTSYQGA